MFVESVQIQELSLILILIFSWKQESVTPRLECFAITGHYSNPWAKKAGMTAARIGAVVTDDDAMFVLRCDGRGKNDLLKELESCKFQIKANEA
ncbi:hypothetical protein L596_028693 [Steinernema carpocapsae]|uniref:Uncharacterized protein n=1 Tax=Steinernema carpocapsae TaxID=34508 RepID=A0A4U5LZ39_STECR|nr:hypothetical protein L596_028693 [Steinernema carpocapsae]